MRATNSCGATVRREADKQIVQSSLMNLAKVDQMDGVIDSLFICQDETDPADFSAPTAEMIFVWTGPC